jgi:FMN-dependent NADH-azoreductase
MAVAINGSPRGKAGATGAMIGAFLDGFQSVGGESESIELADHRIEQCRGCHTCWTATPGSCVHEDDAPALLARMRGADIVVFGTPVYFANVSGTLKTFFDRMTAAGGDPHAAARGGTEQAGATPGPAPRQGWVLVASCGFPDPGQFDVPSLWFTRVCAMAGVTMAGELYAACGRLLSAPDPSQESARESCLAGLRARGAALARERVVGSNISDYCQIYGRDGELARRRA